MMQHDITTDPTTAHSVTVAEAARSLGISSEAVRMRLRRKSIGGYRDSEGRWHVEIATQTQQSTERDRTVGVTVGVTEAPAGEVAELKTERDRLLGLLEAALAERRDQPPTVLTSLRRLVATVTDRLVERMRPRDTED